jgi:hypothetical protein
MRFNQILSIFALAIAFSCAIPIPAGGGEGESIKTASTLSRVGSEESTTHLAPNGGGGEREELQAQHDSHQAVKNNAYAESWDQSKWKKNNPGKTPRPSMKASSKTIHIF